MSIKIIKNTMTDPIEITCSECGSIISYTYDDIQRKTIYNFLGMDIGGVERFIICPVCKSNINLNPVVVVEGEEND